jgi:hypothetical protein
MTLVLTPLNDSQRDLFIKLAQELHVKIEVIDEEHADTRDLLKLAETSFSKEWGGAEDAHWDTYLKPTADVSKR